MSDLVLWAWILASPLVWFLNLAVSYSVAAHICAAGNKTVLYVSTVLSLCITAAAAGLCAAQWRRLPLENAPWHSAVAH